MKKIIVIAIIVAIGWYGSELYRTQGLPFLQRTPTDSAHKGNVKCITKDGGVIYGSVPYGTTCERVEPLAVPVTTARRSAPGQKEGNSRAQRFTCDGRTYCSQMTSCEEATFFLKNCPGAKMDGNNDGIPCEKQWCK